MTLMCVTRLRCMSDARDTLIAEVAHELRTKSYVKAGQHIAAFSKLDRLPRVAEEAMPLLYSLLQWCLDHERTDQAARLLWDEAKFTTDAPGTKLLWRTFDRSALMLIMGAASLGKSYSIGGRLLLEWVRDPENTSVKLIGPSEQHLEDNLFSHLVDLHRESSLPLPGTIQQLFIGLNTRQRFSSISGVVIPIGKTKAAGRLQGFHNRPRKHKHPIFGTLSRLFIFLDELEEVPLAVWKDIDNSVSNVNGVENFKIIGAYNPRDMNGNTGQRAEPQQGWQLGFDIEKSEQWRSKRGWDVVRLDAYRCPNVVQKKVIYPGLQTAEGLQNVISNAGGIGTPGYFTMARGCYPPEGVNFAVIPQGILDRFKGKLIFSERPSGYAGVDLALTGGDAAVYAHGLFGIAVGVELPPSIQHPKGTTTMFQDSLGRSRPRYGLQVEAIFELPKGETVAMTRKVREFSLQLGVQPGHIMLDKTGHGAGVVDLLREIWSPEIMAVNYSEAATEKKIFEEDEQTPKEVYQKLVSELWFALKKWIEFDFVKLAPAIDTAELYRQLGKRRYAPGKLAKVEEKDDYRSREMASSPNEADAVTLLVHGIRMAAGVSLSMKGELLPATESGPGLDDGEPVVVCDCTNRLEREDWGIA